MAHEEQVLWKLIRECGLVWLGSWQSVTDAGTEQFKWKITQASLRMDLLRKHWQTFKDVATGATGAESLPKWGAERPASGKPRPQPVLDTEMDDDVPF